MEETLAFLADDQPPTYSSARTSSSGFSYDSEAAEVSCVASKPMFHSAFTKDVLLAFVGYGILALYGPFNFNIVKRMLTSFSHTICIETLLPLFYEMPRSGILPLLPFKFTGGLGLSAKTVGFIISGQGLISMLVQIFVYPAASSRLGSVALFRWTCFFYPVFYFLVPYLAVLPEKIGFFGIFLVMVAKVTLGSFLVPSIQIILVKSAPSKKVLGTVNGFGASVATVCRGLGPIISGAVQDEGLKLGYVGMAWWFLSATAVLGYLESLLITGTCAQQCAEQTSPVESKEIFVNDRFPDAPGPPIVDGTERASNDPYPEPCSPHAFDRSIKA